MLNSDEDWATLLKSRAIKKYKPIRYHIFSSIWSSIKAEFLVIEEHSTWLIGNGNSINFWQDSWCGDPLVSVLNINTSITNHLPQLVGDYIAGSHWNIPIDMLVLYPQLRSLVFKVIILVEDLKDQLIWKHAENGHLTLKDVYTFKKTPGTKKHWASTIWCKDIPPSKSLLAWRLMHDKVPTDEKLMERGCNLPSMCSLCSMHSETSFHLFFECNFAFNLWCWLASVLDTNLHFQSMEDIWTLCDRSWSQQCKVVVLAAIINIMSTIWFARKQFRFQGKPFNWRIAINNIIVAVSLTGNNTLKSSNSSVRDLIILKKCNVNIHAPKAPVIKEIIWQPPYQNWLKCNTNGAASPNTSSCGGIFRDSEAVFQLAFAENIGGGTTFHAELSRILRAIEIADQRNWRNLWIETDSALVVLAFKSMSLIPCRLRNRWRNCKGMLDNMNFMVTHIYREGNQCADSLAAWGLNANGLTVWTDVPLFIREYYVKNRLGMPNFRFINF